MGVISNHFQAHGAAVILADLLGKAAGIVVLIIGVFVAGVYGADNQPPTGRT